MSLMPHWPNLETLSNDCLFCAISACEDSPHAEDIAFAAACQQEMSVRLRTVRLAIRAGVPLNQVEAVA